MYAQEINKIKSSRINVAKKVLRSYGTGDDFKTEIVNTPCEKKPVFSTYLRSSRYGKNFGWAAKDQEAFVGIEYTDSSNERKPPERKRIKIGVKVGQNNCFNLKDCINEKYDVHTETEIDLDTCEKLIDNMANFFVTAKYRRFLCNSNTFVKNICKDAGLQNIASLHGSAWTAGSAANKIGKIPGTFDPDGRTLPSNGRVSIEDKSKDFQDLMNSYANRDSINKKELQAILDGTVNDDKNKWIVPYSKPVSFNKPNIDKITNNNKIEFVVPDSMSSLFNQPLGRQINMEKNTNNDKNKWIVPYSKPVSFNEPLEKQTNSVDSKMTFYLLNKLLNEQINKPEQQSVNIENTVNAFKSMPTFNKLALNNQSTQKSTSIEERLRQAKEKIQKEQEKENITKCKLNTERFTYMENDIWNFLLESLKRANTGFDFAYTNKKSAEDHFDGALNNSLLTIGFKALKAMGNAKNPDKTDKVENFQNNVNSLTLCFKKDEKNKETSQEIYEMFKGMVPAFKKRCHPIWVTGADEYSAKYKNAKTWVEKHKIWKEFNDNNLEKLKNGDVTLKLEKGDMYDYLGALSKDRLQ